jgi:hypothetical protein
LSCPTVEAAAEAVGIGNLTASQWRKDPAFAERYRESTREAMRQAAARLQGAARAILEMAVKAADLEDVQQRLDALEETLKEREAQ